MVAAVSGYCFTYQTYLSSTTTSMRGVKEQHQGTSSAAQGQVRSCISTREEEERTRVINTRIVKVSDADAMLYALPTSQQMVNDV